jgi:hypothetical protein
VNLSDPSGKFQVCFITCPTPQPIPENGFTSFSLVAGYGHSQCVGQNSNCLTGYVYNPIYNLWNELTPANRNTAAALDTVLGMLQGLYEQSPNSTIASACSVSIANCFQFWVPGWQYGGGGASSVLELAADNSLVWWATQVNSEFGAAGLTTLAEALDDLEYFAPASYNIKSNQICAS